MKTLILTPNKNEMCGMYQLAKDLAKEFDGTIKTKGDGFERFTYISRNFDTVISFLYPMHWWAKRYKTYGLKWICYDQGVPPVTKENFPNIFRMIYMSYFEIMNKRSMKGADEYWELPIREQKPRWTEKKKDFVNDMLNPFFPYATYIGRRTDYKNFDWLQKTMKELDIPFEPSQPNSTDDEIYELLSGAKLLVSASLWEGYGRPVMEAEALGIPAIAYATGTHAKHIKKGICVPLGDEEGFKEAIREVWENE